VKRYWWIVSLLGGMAGAGFFGWRMWDQRVELDRAQIQKHLEAVQTSIIEGTPSKIPYSKRYEQLARAARQQLTVSVDSEDGTSVYAKNQPGIKKIIGYAEYNSGLSALDEAFHGDGTYSDPNPERYLIAYELIEQAIASGYLDMPNPENADYERLHEFAKDAMLNGAGTRAGKVVTAPEPIDPIKHFRIKLDGAKALESADRHRLWEVGVDLLEPQSKQQSRWYDLRIGEPISEAQLQFLGERAVVHQDLDAINLRLAHRFAEMDQPEYAWQFYSVLFDDSAIGSLSTAAQAPIKLRSLLGRVIDARRNQLELLAELASAAADGRAGMAERISDEVEAAREAYNTALATYGNEIVGAVTGVVAGKEELNRLWESFRKDERIQADTLRELMSFDVNEYRESMRPRFETEEKLEAAVRLEQKIVQDRLVELKRSDLVRLERVRTALRTLEQFTDHVRVETSDLATRYQLFRDNGLTQDAFVNLLNSAPVLRDLITKVVEKPEALRAAFERRPDIVEALHVRPRMNAYMAEQVAERGENNPLTKLERTRLEDGFYAYLYIEALRSFPMLDLNILRTRVARLLGDAESAQNMVGDDVRLGEIEANMELVNEVAVDAELLGFEFDPNFASSEDSNMPSVRFLEAVISHFNRGAQAGIQVDVANQRLNRQLELEMRAIRDSVVEASFEHAELQYQLTLSQLQRITNRGNQNVPASMARDFAIEHRAWAEAARKAHQRGDPLPEKDFLKSDEAQFKYRPLLEYIELEMQYRRQRERAESAYNRFLDNPNALIQQRARYGLVSLALDKIMYNYDWKWRFGFGTDPLDPVNGNARPYGIFAWVEGQPDKVPATPLHGPLDGTWLREDRVVPYYQAGVPVEEARSLAFWLDELRLEVTPSEDPHLYAAIRLRSGQLMEFVNDRSVTAQPRARGTTTGFYLGNLPGAIKTFYMPLLKENYFNEQDPLAPEGTMRAQAYLVRNRYIPLADHFNRVNDKVQRMLRDVDEDEVFGDNTSAIEILFAALTPDETAEDQAMAITEFYDNYLRAVLEHQPGLIELPEAKYDLFYRMGQLSSIDATQMLDRIDSINRDVIRRKVTNAERFGQEFFRSAGRTLSAYNNEFPNARGEAQRQLKIGDAYFQSGDYVFALASYRAYFERRRQADTREERAEQHYVANRIGESYMKLGTYEGNALRQALASGDEGRITDERDVDTKTLDAAIPAFEWVVERTRESLGRPGDGGFASNRLPPVGSLDAFINLARAQTELAKLVIGRDQPRAVALLQEAVDLLQGDLVNEGIFPEPMPGFQSSLYYRDAEYQIGVAEIELARAQILPSGGVGDYAVFRSHLDNAQQALRYLMKNFPDAVNRGVYERALEDDRTVNDAISRASVPSGKFGDDIYYLATYQMADVSWLRANMNPKPRSDETVRALEDVIPRLTMLLDALSEVWDKDRPVNGSSRTFPELDKDTRYQLADALFLLARTRMEQQDQGGSVMRSELLKHFRAASEAYSNARKVHDETYEAAWAYLQEFECQRQLGALQVAASQRLAEQMLDRADTFLDGMPDSAFQGAPESMTREAFRQKVDWIRRNEPIGG